MNQLSQAETRLWTGEGAKPFRIPDRLARVRLPRRIDVLRSVHQAWARSAHRSLILVAAALAAAAVAGGVVSTLTYRAGLAWRDRAATEIVRTHELVARLSAAQTQAARATYDLSVARAQLAAMTSQLQRSEADVAQLEGRLQALGTEKAKVEDEREAVRGDRDRLAELTGLAARVGHDVDTCMSGLSNWLTRRPLLLSTTQPALWAAWASSGEEVASSCANAHVSNEQLKAAING
jgi:hypothetical protein